MSKAFPCYFLLLLVFAASGRAAAPLGLAEAIVLTPQAGGTREDAEIARWQTRAQENGAKAEIFERLGWAFVAKARRTLDAGYYKLAEKTADAMDERFGASAESRLLRGHVLHNLHRFHEAEAVARQLVAERSGADDLALLSDALMEQGKLGEAVEALQRAVNLKPGTEAYSRIAHLRWLKGDLPGAINAMEMAERANSPLDSETCAWTLARLSSYYLQADQGQRALAMAESALTHLPDYPPALLARGRVLVALGKNDDAIEALRRAAMLNPLPEYQWWLAETLRAAGRATDAAKVEEEIKGHAEASDPRTLALFLATRRVDTAKAVRLAREELTNRGDVFSHDALAWALAASGDSAAAGAEMEQALAERTKDARLFLHAGEIALSGGRREAATDFFRRALPLANTLLPGERALLVKRLESAAALARMN